MESKTIRMPEYLWAFLGALAEELGYRDPRGDHSRVIREMVSAAANRWQESPYIAQSSRNVVLVTRAGHLFFRQVQVLKLKKKRERLPCLLDLLAARRSEPALARPRWLFNHFAVWRGSEVAFAEAAPLAVGVDRHRTDAKLADLVVSQGPDHYVTREIVAGLEGYAHWQDGGQDYDQVDFPIDIPTLNLEFLVVVDLELYRQTARTAEEMEAVPNLRLEFRNRELARFEGETLGNEEFNRLSPPLRGKCLASGRGAPGAKGKKPRRGTADPREEMLQGCRDLEARVAHLLQAQAEDGPVVAEADRGALRQALTLPESFLYYKRRWPSPYFGVEVGIQWEQPERPE